MMRKIIKLGQTDVRCRIKMLLSIIACLFSLLLLSAPSAFADYYYLKPGQSRTIDAPVGLDTIFVSNPSIADYKVIGERKVVIYGRQAGYSDITLYDAQAKVLKKISIEVDPLLSDVLNRVKSLYPESKIKIAKITASDEGNSVYVLSGTAPNEQSLDEIYRIVGQSLGAKGKDYTVSVSAGGSAGGTSASSGELSFMSQKVYDNVINRLTLPQTNQVNVRLTVVEVNKEFKDSLGIDWTNIGGGDSGTFTLKGFKGFDRMDIHNRIRALQNDDVARVLAQPNLTVMSGEVASFLVGGEVPITVRDVQNNSVSIEYKEYGVKLSIAAKVKDSNKINLFLANELSNIDETYAQYSVPTFRTRKTSSTIELADGDSFAIAGLLNESDIESLSKIPFAGDIPILGALARNTALTRKKTELMVFATVNLVRPTTSSANIELPSFKKTSMSKLFFNVGVNKQTRENRLNNNTQLSHDSEVFLNRGGFAK